VIIFDALFKGKSGGATPTLEFTSAVVVAELTVGLPTVEPCVRPYCLARPKPYKLIPCPAFFQEKEKWLPFTIAH
jgi:hypothetical protein